MKIRLITILILVLVLVLATLVPTILVSAKNDKPPVPHHNKPDKTVPANCHSRHAREAGMTCDTSDGTDDSETNSSSTATESVPNSKPKQLPKHNTEPDIPPVTVQTVMGQGLKYGCGGHHSVHVFE